MSLKITDLRLPPHLTGAIELNRKCFLVGELCFIFKYTNPGIPGVYERFLEYYDCVYMSIYVNIYIIYVYVMRFIFMPHNST